MVNDLKEMIRIGKSIGLETIDEYKTFAERERRPNETLLEALKRYEKELNDEK
jgi:hypothetical protein